MEKVDYKVALVTGGTRGIGKAIVLRLVECGYRVAFTYHTRADLAETLLAELNATELCAIALQCDGRDIGSVREAVAHTMRVFGRIDALVNNAGISRNNLLIDTDFAEYRAVMGANMDSVYAFCHEVVPHMLGDGGAIVNVSSVWGVYGASMESVYSASKAGVIGLTRALAKEVGYNNIRVNCVAPGVIDTDMNSCHSAETLVDLAQNTPLGRIGKAEEVANVVEFLLSDRASFVTGQVIEVTGGFVG